MASPSSPTYPNPEGACRTLAATDPSAAFASFQAFSALALFLVLGNVLLREELGQWLWCENE